MYLYHYFENQRGPFLTTSDLSHSAAVDVLSEIQKTNPNLVHPDMNWFLTRRRELESRVREQFIQKGGKPIRQVPHHMTVENCDYMKTWYLEPCSVKIHISEFDINTISFTYGDMFPVFNPRLDNGEEYRNQVYTYDEIVKIIKKYGLPQFADKKHEFASECYVEACIWSDEIVIPYREKLINTINYTI